MVGKSAFCWGELRGVEWVEGRGRWCEGGAGGGGGRMGGVEGGGGGGV
jgi:hypothetical protein